MIPLALRDTAVGEIYSPDSRVTSGSIQKSFCISRSLIKNKNHEREIETAILRAASSQMVLNQRKVRTGLKAGMLPITSTVHFLLNVRSSEEGGNEEAGLRHTDRLRQAVSATSPSTSR
jgi:hypothetical protein